MNLKKLRVLLNTQQAVIDVLVSKNSSHLQIHELVNYGRGTQKTRQNKLKTLLSIVSIN